MQQFCPPRYFVGFLDFAGGLRWTFDNAILIPVSEFRADINIGSEASAFYEGKIPREPRIAGRGAKVLGIQYAISTLDVREGSPLIQKFNHAFSTDVRFCRHADGFSFYLMSASGETPIYRSQPLRTLFEGCDSSLPATQFIN